MQIKVSGLVVMESNLAEHDKFITILTSELGLIRAVIKNVRSLRNKNISATQLFSYSKFVLYKGKSGYIVDDSEVTELFFSLRNDIKKIALSQYFCDLALALSPENGDARDFLRLILNSLAYLCNGKRSLTIVKSIIEIRMLTMAGYMPNLICCKECAKYDDDIVHFSLGEGVFYCKECSNNSSKRVLISLRRGTLSALRHIVYSPFESLFNFVLSNESQNELSKFSERYLIYQLDRNFKTLDFYNTIS